MNSTYKFNIEVNKAGQRVVVIDERLTSSNCEPISYEDFDAVLYKTEDIRILVYQFTDILNVFSNNAFQFKPFFFSPKINRVELVYTCDGLADDINSQILIDETIRIQNRMSELGFKIFKREPSFWSIDNYFYAFVRHSLSRADILPKLRLIKGSPFGYMHPILYTMFRTMDVSATKFLSARSKFQGDFQYVEPVDLLAIVHVCPSCNDKNVLYQETCPKCSSIDIREQNMIHHFRCANISSEQTYMNDGMLICPKCKRELHHIGVDYDRPTTSYTCNSCSITFSSALVVCECEVCGIKSPSESLVPVKMGNMMVNSRGKKMLPITDHMIDSDSVAKYPNILSFNQFKSILEVRLNISRGIRGSNHILRVYRSIVASEADLDRYAPDLISLTYSLMPFANISNRKNVNYLLVESHVGSELDKRLEMRLRELELAMQGKVVSMDYIEYDGHSEPHHFIDIL